MKRRKDYFTLVCALPTSTTSITLPLNAYHRSTTDLAQPTKDERFVSDLLEGAAAGSLFPFLTPEAFISSFLHFFFSSPHF